MVLLGSMMAVGPLSTDMYLPAFPTIERQFGAESGSLQVTFAAYFAGLACGQAFYGPISDRFGRKSCLYFGLTLFIVAALGCAASNDVVELSMWRVLQGIGGCSPMVITLAIIRDRVTGAEAARTFSRLLLVMGVAPIVAPLVGGWLLTTFGWQAIFVLLATMAATSLVLMHFGLPETLDPASKQSLNLKRVFTNYGDLLKDRSFMGHALAGATAVSGMYGYIAASPYVFIEIHGIPASQFGWYFGANVVGFIGGSQINAWLATRYGSARIIRRSVIMPALAGCTLAAFALAGWVPLPVLVLCFFAYIGSLGFITPNSMSLALSRQGHRAGTASALMGIMTSSLGIVAGLTMSAWHDGTVWPLGCLMAACGVLALSTERFVAAPSRQQSVSPPSR